MHASSARAVKAVAERNWDLLIHGIIGVAVDFRRVMDQCSRLSGEERGKYVLRCGREHHAAKAKIAAALKKEWEK